MPNAFATGNARHHPLRAPGRTPPVSNTPPITAAAINCTYFCAEPVSNTTDWLNQRPEGTVQRIDVGSTVLAPGETLGAQLAWQPERS